MPGPMDGVRVVEIGLWVAGPAAGGVLADWGADVVKIESSAGDPARNFGRLLSAGQRDDNPVFEMDNRSKRSIVLDLASDEDREIAHELVAGADVFLTNLRPGALARLGLDVDSVVAANPSVIYAHLTGYGPDVDEPSYDIAAFWARSGIAAMLTPEGQNPPFQRGGMGDHSTGMTMAGAISAALFARERSEDGRGQLVTASLLRQGVYTISFDLNVTMMWGESIAIGTRDTIASPTTNYYRTADDRMFWIVGLEGERHWPPLARAVGHPEWIEDERYADPLSRYQNARGLIADLDDIFATKTLDEWAAIFATEPDFFWAPINGPDDLLADPAFYASGATVEVPDGEATIPMIASPVDFHGTPWQPRSVAPGLGEHTDEILRELGREPRS